LICYKNCIVCSKRSKINEKEAGVGPFKKIKLKKLEAGGIFCADEATKEYRK